MGIGYIYILSNPAMPRLLKIGFTRGDVDARAAKLSAGTGIPAPFEVEYYCLTSDVEEVEAMVHQRFGVQRAKGREFFEIDVEGAVRVIDELIRSVQPHRYCRVPPRSPSTTEAKAFSYFPCPRGCGTRNKSTRCSACGHEWG